MKTKVLIILIALLAVSSLWTARFVLPSISPNQRKNHLINKIVEYNTSSVLETLSIIETQPPTSALDSVQVQQVQTSQPIENSVTEVISQSSSIVPTSCMF